MPHSNLLPGANQALILSLAASRVRKQPKRKTGCSCQLTLFYFPNPVLCFYIYIFFALFTELLLMEGLCLLRIKTAAISTLIFKSFVLAFNLLFFFIYFY